MKWSSSGPRKGGGPSAAAVEGFEKEMLKEEMPVR